MSVVHRATAPWRRLSATASVQRVTNFSGDQLWWAIRKPGLDQNKNAGGRRTILVQRVDFWEESKYGHGGAAKLWPGISGDHDSFKDGLTEEGTPIERELPVHVQEKEKQDQVFSSVDDFLTWTREYWLNRLNRGYTGKSIAGMYIPTISPKDAQREFGRTFDDFKVSILEIGRVGYMAPKAGRIYSARATVVVGNGKGIYGVATAQEPLATSAIISARRQAFKNLQSIHLHEGRTISNEVFFNFHKTYMSLRPQPRGFGIRANRYLKRILDVAGIKDIHCHVKGSRAVLPQINCLLRALHEVESPYEQATRTGYSVVKIDPQKCDKPEIVASPNTARLNVSEQEKPVNSYKEYFNQKPIIDFFNYNTSGVHRQDHMSNKFHNRVFPGRAGSHMFGFMSYKQMPRSVAEISDAELPHQFICEKDGEFLFKTNLGKETSKQEIINTSPPKFNLTCRKGFAPL